ncbi:MAG TPA: type II toxin-antitoxin system RelE/ParE family toxin [Candidatus Acidoferrum sp.]|nr:type II toxin-antitoxin system RelE/ParE family toxin [Candidatus Acidoferrum sp.]
MRYRVSENTERDLEEIFLYWAERASLEIADRIIDKITDRFWLLGEHSDAGKKSDETAAGVKCFPAGKYLIYYRATRRGPIFCTSSTERGTSNGLSGKREKGGRK